MKIKHNLEEVRKMAKTYGWVFTDHQENVGLVSFRKDGARLNLYYTTGTVGTSLDHPKKGKTQMFRKGVDMELLEKLFKNPRLHTRKGYIKK